MLFFDDEIMFFDYGHDITAQHGIDDRNHGQIVAMKKEKHKSVLRPIYDKIPTNLIQSHQNRLTHLLKERKRA